MTANTNQLAKVGDIFHFAIDGVTYARSKSLGDGVVSHRGDEVTITESLLEASRDRNGDSWLHLLHDPDTQVRRWGRLAFAPGPFPTNEVSAEPGTVARELAREKARQAAVAITDRAARTQAMQQVQAVYGGPRPTSQTLATYGRES